MREDDRRREATAKLLGLDRLPFGVLTTGHTRSGVDKANDLRLVEPRAAAYYYPHNVV
jgi:hypothetical protein